MFSIAIFDKGIVIIGSRRLKTWFIVYFKSLFNGFDKFLLSERFSFSTKENRSFLYNF